MIGWQEFNFDGLVGPTHNYAGLAYGNLASARHKGLISSPRAAALEGLAKMRFLMELGVPQAVLPPHERPALWVLRDLGFQGNDAAVLERVGKEAPELLASVSSASAMWTANAATVTPSHDSADRRVQFSPANLQSTFHRAIETAQTARTLRAIFADENLFKHHPPLPPLPTVADEGAANHTRLAPRHASSGGLHLFTYGASASKPAPRPKRYPARQSYEASSAIVRRHRIPEESILLIPQNPQAIDAGVFHNDVIAVGNENLLLCHEHAFADGANTADAIAAAFRNLSRTSLCLVTVPDRLLSLSQAVRTYFFNSQVVSLPEGGMLLLMPSECRGNTMLQDFLDECVADSENPLREFNHVNIRQSMRNGGGPACLRLRVLLNKQEVCSLNTKRVILDRKLYSELEEWVRRHYRESLTPADLVDPELLQESRAALDELTKILRLGSIFPFQT